MEVRCCVCGKVRQGKQWRKATPAIKIGEVSHGYCPKCAKDTFQALRNGGPLPAATAQHL